MTTCLTRSSTSSPLLRRRSFSSSVKVTSRPIRWGILSAGKISSDYVKAISITEGAEVAAVAARSAEKAESFAQAHDIPKSYGSYDELLQDPSIDVVYVGSIANQHYHMAVQSLLAKKPTVVEKPLTLSLRDTEKLVQLAKQQDVFLMEGMWTRCFPAMRKVKQLIEEGAIGKVSTIQGDFGWSTKDCGPEDRIWEKGCGGMTLDIGMYMVQLGQVGFQQSPSAIQAMGSHKNGVDHTILTNIQYGQDGFLQFYVTGDANTEERVVIQGTEGRIVLDPPAHVPTTIRLFTDQGRGSTNEQVLEFPLPDDSYTTWNYPGSIGFTHQIQAVGEALKAGKKECLHFTHDNSLELAAVLDDILQQVNGRPSDKEDADHDVDQQEMV